MPTVSPPPRVSVLVPVLNSARFLGEALQSIAAQTYSPIEVIVVDGASTDDTPHIAQSFPFVRYLRQTRVNMWNALNEGFELAQGECIAMLSSDDLWLPEKVALQFEYLLAHPDV